MIFNIEHVSDFPLKKGDYVSIMRNGSYFHKGVEIQSFHFGEVMASGIKELFKKSAGVSRFLGYIREVKEAYAEVVVVRFVHLHLHSSYSLLDGLSSIEEIVNKVNHSCALTDHGNMFGMLKFYKAMNKAGKKPILGFEAYVEDMNGKLTSNHLVLIAKNEKGVNNLMKLTSEAFSNFYNKAHVSYANLKKYSEGVICSSACLGGEIPRLLINGETAKADEVIKMFKGIYGADFYLEIQNHSIAEEKIVSKKLYELGKKHGVKLIATGDSHYTDEDDSKVHEVVLCLQTKKKITDADRFKFPGEGYHIYDEDEVFKRFSEYPEAIENTLEILEKIDFKLNLGDVHMPHFECPAEFKDEAEYFSHLCWKGFHERFAGTSIEHSVEYRERLQFEIDTISNMQFPGYFLIVWDFVRYAKENGIAVGPGRGSVVGSLVAYVLQITNLDPIPYGLLFERFLNPERISMPDIDLDFDDERRDEVINYVRVKYGDDAVSKIVTFGTMGANSAIRDVGRVLDYNYAFVDKIAKAIPKDLGITITKALNQSAEFRDMYDNDEDVKKIVDIALKLEGRPRHTSIHACGVIIAPSEVSDYLPETMIEDKDTKIKERTSQLDKDETEEMGLLKMDFLGLRTMGVLSNAEKLVNARRRKEGLSPIDYEKLIPNDVEVYKFISKGELKGVFQLESAGMTKFMKELFSDANDLVEDVYKSKVIADKKEALDRLGIQFFERLIAGISLYRPGPMDEIPNYLENMKNPKKIVYPTPLLKPILEATYGVIVYQEQVMQIVRDLAGYSLGRSDLVRRGMAKKKAEIIAEERRNFVYGIKDENGNQVVPGCINNGISEQIGDDTYSRMADFAKYAFNKSHAGGYAIIAYHTAFFKYYYPIEFMTATLNSVISSSKKLKAYLGTVNNAGITMLPPEVNKSEFKFVPENGAIRFGLKGLKNVGEVSSSIIDERSERGIFVSYQDFVERMAIHHKVDKKMLESLIYSGALDELDGNRRSKLAILEKILKVASNEKAMASKGQISIFSLTEELQEYKIIPIPDLEEFHKRTLLDKELEYTGLYVTGHPLDDYSEVFKVEEAMDIMTFVMEEDDEVIIEDGSERRKESFHGKVVKFGGIVKECSVIHTKKGAVMKKFILEDKTAEIECILFPKQTSSHGHFVSDGSVVFVDGTFSEDDFGVKVIVNSVSDASTIKLKGKPQQLWLKIDNEFQVKELKNIIGNNRGELPVYIKRNGKTLKYNDNIDLNLSVFSRLREVFGENVYVKYA